ILPADRKTPLESIPPTTSRRRKRKNNLLRMILYRQLTHENIRPLPGSRDPPRHQPYPRMMLHIEIRLAPQMIIPHPVIAIDRGSRDADVEMAFLRFAGIELDLPRQPAQRTGDIEPQIFNFELDRRTRILRLKRGLSNGLPDNEHTQNKSDVLHRDSDILHRN